MAAAGSEVEPELETLLQAGEPEEVAEVPRPLSPTRLQPVLPPEAQTVPEFEEVARVLAEMPRPLKRRGSMEQSPGPVLPPTHKKQYQQIISRLFHHRPRREEPVPSADAPLEPSTVVLATPSPTLPQPSPPGPASLPLPAAPESPASPVSAAERTGCAGSPWNCPAQPGLQSSSVARVVPSDPGITPVTLPGPRPL